jgi:hypothetical protein
MKRKIYCGFCNKDVLEEGHISLCSNCQGQLHNRGDVKVCACCGKTYPASATPFAEPVEPRIDLEPEPMPESTAEKTE